MPCMRYGRGSAVALRLKVSLCSFRTSDILTSDCLAAVQIKLLRSRVESVIDLHALLDIPNQFLTYVRPRRGNLISLDENGQIISFFGLKRNGLRLKTTKPPRPRKGKAADSTLHNLLLFFLL